MADTQDEAEWRAEFERIGEEQAYSLIHSGIIPESKRQFGFRWLGEQAGARKRREAETFRYVKMTLWAAVGAVLVGIIGVAVTWFHR
jgi:nitrate reductase NapE component